MCDSARFADKDGAFCHTQGELKRMLGLYVLPIYDGYGGADDDACLCPVDFSKITGWKIIKQNPQGEYDPFDVWFYKEEHKP